MNSNITRQLAEIRRQVKNRQDAQGVLNALDVTQHIAPVYMPLHEDIQAQQHLYYNLPGGRGSGKSSFCALEIVNGIMHDPTGESNAIVFRRTANTMRESVYSQIAWAIDVLDVNHLWRGNVSPMSWTYKPTGAQIIFRGLDDSSKLKSIKPRRGFFRFIWLEEFSELPGENFTRSVMQSVQRGGERFTVFRSFNPPINQSNWANVFIARPDPRAITLHTSYLDVPAEWLGEEFIIEAERLREINEQAYKHEYLGEATGSGGEVFPNITVRTITDDEINELQYIYAGVDFGFSVDPAVFMRVAYDRKRDTVYLLDEIYKRHLSNKELAAQIIAKGYNFTGQYQASYYEAYKEKQVIVCDSAEPKSISDLRGEGLRCIACQKYPGSVLYGVKWLQNRHIIIDPARTPHAHKEFISYEYMTTKDGEFLADVPDANNHTIDAVRYALDRLINHRGVSA
ncbi:MAG: PBSX family phage terminase large subunit [Clostridia bacterium]|nr:PBSX family phage terminase large subunit [Clostridia bacterium]